MRRLLTLFALALIMLASASCSKSKASSVTTPAPIERPTPTPYAGPYPWWAQSEGFSLFPMYTQKGEPEAGFENGPKAVDGGMQFALTQVTHDDYKAYLDELKGEGFILYNPYGEFVPQSEVELAALNGGATYMHEGYSFELRYNLRLQTLILQVDK